MEIFSMLKFILCRYISKMIIHINYSNDFWYFTKHYTSIHIHTFIYKSICIIYFVYDNLKIALCFLIFYFYSSNSSQRIHSYRCIHTFCYIYYVIIFCSCFILNLFISVSILYLFVLWFSINHHTFILSVLFSVIGFCRHL